MQFILPIMLSIQHSDINQTFSKCFKIFYSFPTEKHSQEEHLILPLLQQKVTRTCHGKANLLRKQLPKFVNLSAHSCILKNKALKRYK